MGPMLLATPAQATDVVDPTVIVVTEPVAPEPAVTVINTPGGDDSSYQVPLTTTVTFDGVQYDAVYATTNSVITFGRPDGTYWTYPSTPSISLYSMDWVVYPNARSDEHLTIAASDGGFQVDISARPIWLQNATEPTNINIVAAINVDGTVAISYSIAGPTYDGQTRTGVTLTSGQVVTLEQYGIIQVEEAPVLTPEPVIPTPTPTPTPEPTVEPTPTPTVEPTPTPTPTVEPTPTPTPTQEPTPTPTVEPTPTPTPEPTPTPNPAPYIPQGATLLSEGSSIQVVAPEGQRILSITAWYGDPADGSRGVEVSSTLTQLASGQTSVTIDSSNIYGDPAPGTPKTLIFVVNYETLPVPEPTPTPTVPPGVVPEPTPIPEPTPTPEPTPEPTPIPTPEPQPSPAPEPTPEPVIPVVPPVVEPPAIEPQPQPQPIPFPVEPAPVPQPAPEPEPVATPEPTPIPEETIEPSPEPTVEPTIPPTEEPTPEPTPSEEPIKEPEEVEPEPLPEPEQTAPTELPVTEEEAEAAVEQLAEIAPEELTEEQAVVLLAAAEMVLETAIEGSVQYEAALDALAVVAQADDPELPAELVAIPGAAEVLEAFNAIGNFGADMSPATREEAEKIVVAGVVAVNAALSASLVINAGTPAVPSAPSAPAPSGGTSGGSTSGSTGRRVK